MTATSRTRTIVVGLAALLSVGLTACGGMADDAPRDADTQAFCDAFYDRDLTAEKVATKLAEIGTPDGVSADQRRGFELWVEGLDNEGDTPNTQIDRVEVPQGDRDVAEAFTDYVGTTCLAEAPSPTDDPTGSPSQAPSSTPPS
ncbi:hypothetical protein [Nocardioides plantarum]|uniref:Lipoprotein n=1 Tax=Nocardioides plantarum TaxID=29299 RepID=A0ABV5K6W1_9ACTN|nr:hypothetical protein [Nocardioides plantarum]